MTRSSLFSRCAAAIFSSALIFALTVEILDEIPNGEQPPAAVERAPITSPQLDGPYFQQGQADAEAQAQVEVKAEGATPVANTAAQAPQTPETPAPAPAEASAGSAQMAN